MKLILCSIAILASVSAAEAQTASTKDTGGEGTGYPRRVLVNTQADACNADFIPYAKAAECTYNPFGKATENGDGSSGSSGDSSGGDGGAAE